MLEAIRCGEFHVWPIEHINEAIGVLMDLPARELQQEGSLHARVAKRLLEMLAALKELQSAGPSGTRLWTPEPAAPQEPRPPLPGQPATHRL